jgi:hypothetical protein
MKRSSKADVLQDCLRGSLLCLAILCPSFFAFGQTPQTGGAALIVVKDLATPPTSKLADAPLHPDYRASPQAKLRAAKQHIQTILDNDAKPRRGFYGREPTFPAWKDQPFPDCASDMIVRAIQTKAPYFEDKSNRVVVVPVWAELLLVDASQSGGPRASMDNSLPSQCAFEYERWSFTTKRFEKVEGFRTRTHYDEFPDWGESVVNSNINRWVAVDLNKRYVQFLARVNVAREAPYQLAPQFPVHHEAKHSVELLRFYNDRKVKLLAEGKSDRDPKASGGMLLEDLERMKKQLQNGSWAADHLSASLNKLQTIQPFEELKP